ncbi:hypothetical protein CR513_15764, partial [Mucuna pruriens]
MEESLLTTSFMLTYKVMNSSMKFHALILHNKMEWSNERTNILLKQLDCIVFVHLHKHQRSNLDLSVVQCIFLGYVTHTKGYRCCDLIGNQHDKTMIATPLSNVPDDDSPEVVHKVRSLEPSLDENFNINIGYKLPFMHTRGKPQNRYSPKIEKGCSKYPIANYVTTQRLSKSLQSFVHKMSSCHVATGSEWIHRKVQSVISGQRLYPNIMRRLSPTVKLKAERILLSLVTNLDWSLHQYDVKNAFLYKDLKEEVYMDIQKINCYAN